MGLFVFRECGKLMYRNRFPPSLKGIVYRRYVRSVILYGSEEWSMIGIEI